MNNMKKTLASMALVLLIGAPGALAQNAGAPGTTTRPPATTRDAASRAACFASIAFNTSRKFCDAGTGARLSGRPQGFCRHEFGILADVHQGTAGPFDRRGRCARKPDREG